MKLTTSLHYVVCLSPIVFNKTSEMPSIFFETLGAIEKLLRSFSKDIELYHPLPQKSHFFYNFTHKSLIVIVCLK